MRNYLKLEVNLQCGNDRLRVYLRDGIKPLIKALHLEDELIRFELVLNRHEQPTIVVGLLLKTLSVGDLVKRSDFPLNNLPEDHPGGHPIINVGQIVDSNDVVPRNEPDASIIKTISCAMLEVFSQEEMDDDLVFTFGIYLLFVAYTNCSAGSPSVAQAVYEKFMAEADAATLATDRVFQKVKFHVMKPALEDLHEVVSRLKDDNAIWLQNFTNNITEVLRNVRNEAETKTLLIALCDGLKHCLDLGETQLNLLNYFVFQTLSKPELRCDLVNNEIWQNELANIKPQQSHSHKIPLLTYYSPSHKSLFDNFFYPSYQKYLIDDFELVVLNAEQLCTALFEEDNWNKQVKEKIVFVNEFINTTESKYVVFSDVDIVFFENIYHSLMGELNAHDIAFQNDSLHGLTNNLCSGFYCCRVNESTKAFFKKMVDEYNDNLSDQQNLNHLLPKGKNLKYKALSSKFYNFSHADGQIWFNNKKIAFPQHPIIMYHANYTVGTANKEFLLQTFMQWDNLFFS